jgi:hypothetical protein
MRSPSRSRKILVPEQEHRTATRGNRERSNNKPKIVKRRLCSGWPIRSFHPLNYSLYVARLFPFYHPEFSSTRRTRRDKVQFLMRRKHQMVAFTAPSHVIAEPASVGGFALSPLDRDVFIESRHRCPPGRHSIPAAHRIKENEAQ